MPPFIALLALAGIAEGVKAVFQINAEDSREEQINLQTELQTVQYQQKKLNTYDTMQRVLATQTAQATVRGVSLGSPSFNAIQRHTYDLGAKELQNQETELSFVQRNAQIEKSAARSSLYASLFGDVAEIGLKAAELTA